MTTKISVLNPTRAQSAKDELDLLFGDAQNSLSAEKLAVVLPWLMVAYAWRLNVRYLSRRLNQLRDKAMSDPSLRTFRPIPMLRQNVADLQDALQEAKDSIGEADTLAFAELEKLAGHPLESLDGIFDTLLKQASALYLTASNEIQLVIGSVTIMVILLNQCRALLRVDPNFSQDSDMMKRQSRRATLLTLLAAFYLPLTLVTGIFGMNIKEFDDVKPSFVLCFEALFAVTAVTIIFYGLYRYLPMVFRMVQIPYRVQIWGPVFETRWMLQRLERHRGLTREEWELERRKKKNNFFLQPNEGEDYQLA